MSQGNCNNLGCIVASVVIGLAAVVSVNLLKEPLTHKNQFEFKQEGPVFLRFNKSSSELCFTGIGPNGRFVTDAWLCMQGDKTKAGEVIQPSDGENTTSTGSKKDSQKDKDLKKKDK